MYVSDFPPHAPFCNGSSRRLYNFLRQIPSLLIVALVALYASDLRRYDLAPSTADTSDSALALDVVALVVLGHCAIWSNVLWFAWLNRPDSKVPLKAIAIVDFVLWASLLALGDTTLAMRSSSKHCGDYIGGCGTGTIGANIAAGTLMIVLAEVYQGQWIMVLHLHWERNKKGKCQPRDREDEIALGHDGGIRAEVR